MIKFYNDKPNSVGSYAIKHNKYSVDSNAIKDYIVSVLGQYGLSVQVIKVIGVYAEVKIIV